MWVCKKCNQEMKKAVLEEYEYEEGVLLKNVEAVVCPKSEDFLFTEEQLEVVEKRSAAMKAHLFRFKRKLTVSGRSLVFNIPEDIVRHMKLKKGQDIDLRPLDDKRFIIEIK
ncbi:hypothetical protein HY988_04150 [Candidatus Micrarchaeota archaeon]|nr:hypothetical protein [Candidatus Micrarchaeota archaeon]